MTVKGTHKRLAALLAGALLAMSLIGGSATATSPLQGQVTAAGAAGPAQLQYQGRLLDPTSGAPKPDGFYAMTFRLYDVETDGTALWTDARNCLASRGLVSTNLGDVLANPLPLAAFDGRDLWLGITIGGDAEVSPRMRFTYVPYALYARVPGPHQHGAADVASGTLSTDLFSAYADLAAESKIGAAAGLVAAGDHTHSLFSTITVARVQYGTPRAHTLSVPPQAFVPSRGGYNYYNSPAGDPPVGAHLVGTVPGVALVAPVELPDGAVVELMRVFCDHPSGTVAPIVRLRAWDYKGRRYVTADPATLECRWTDYGYDDVGVRMEAVDNAYFAYFLEATAETWNGASLFGVTLDYTLSEAQ